MVDVSYDQLSPDQIRAIEEARRWFDSRDSRAFRVSGPAGSGKTTTARHIINALGTTTQALAPTNRAARILRTRGVHGARTIHSVLFQPVNWCWTMNHQVDSRCIQEEAKHTHGPRFFKRVDPPEGVRCFTIDESSMVGKRIGDDVALFGIKTIVIGDPYQLPPVMDEPAYTSDLPGVDLEFSHRFAADGSIGHLANIIRTSPGLKDWKHLIPYVKFDDIDNYSLLLAWRNETRWQIITTLRSIRGKSLEIPQIGDRLISVANTYEVGVLNADELTVNGPVTDATHMGAINIPTREKGIVQAWRSGFKDFDGEKWAASQSRRKGSDICALTWSECMTVHKAQGGEWPNVLIVDDLDKMSYVLKEELKTWAYTAVTRASESVDFIKINDFPTGMRLRQLVSSGR